MSNPYDTHSEKVSVLGPTLRFKGELTADEDLVVHGTIEGTLGPAPRVTIGPDAKVKANVSATTVIVEGTVHGNLAAQSSVVVKESATVEGNIEAPAVSILEGARFNGNVSMGAAAARKVQTPPKSESKPDFAAPAKTGTTY
jgi:cytoskeletal protein CcmA (bactofilin family)